MTKEVISLEDTLELALEALEDYRRGCLTKYEANKAITAIKKALERQIKPAVNSER